MSSDTQSLDTTTTYDRRQYDVELQGLQVRVTKIEADVAAILEIVSAAKGAFKVLEVVGRLAKPLIYIGTISSAITYYIKTGRTLP